MGDLMRSSLSTSRWDKSTGWPNVGVPEVLEARSTMRTGASRRGPDAIRCFLLIHLVAPRLVKALGLVGFSR